MPSVATFNLENRIMGYCHWVSFLAAVGVDLRHNCHNNGLSLVISYSYYTGARNGYAGEHSLSWYGGTLLSFVTIWAEHFDRHPEYRHSRCHHREVGGRLLIGRSVEITRTRCHSDAVLNRVCLLICKFTIF